MSASPELAGNGMRPAPVCRCGQVHVVENRDQPLATSLRHDQALQPDSIRRVAPIRALCPCHLPGHIHRCHVRLEVFDADDGVMNRAVPERLLVVRRSPVRDVSSGTCCPTTFTFSESAVRSSAVLSNSWRFQYSTYWAATCLMAASSSEWLLAPEVRATFFASDCPNPVPKNATSSHIE